MCRVCDSKTVNRKGAACAPCAKAVGLTPRTPEYRDFRHPKQANGLSKVEHYDITERSMVVDGYSEEALQLLAAVGYDTYWCPLKLQECAWITPQAMKKFV